MDIWVPKYKEIYIRDGGIAIQSGFQGEYRAKLYGENGKLKSDTGWKPNTLLDRGLLNLSVPTVNAFGGMTLGDSGVAVDITQTGLQGNSLAYNKTTQPVSAVNSGTPNYINTSVEDATYPTGEGTGTVREFVLHHLYADAALAGSVRVVLDTPIVKGPLDELVIEHRLTHYPELVDQTGTLDMSGTDYDYTMRHTNAHFSYNHMTNVAIGGGNSTTQTAGDYVLGAIDELPVGTSFSGLDNEELTYGGGLGTYYTETEWIVGIDVANGTNINLFMGAMAGSLATGIGVQVHFVQTIGGASLLKEDTHELRFAVRGYPVRYIP